MTQIAYPNAPADVRETLAKKGFIDALKSADMRKKTQQSRPQNFNDAIRHAVWFYAFAMFCKTLIYFQILKDIKVDLYTK